jgi:hypothetical protein
VAIAVVKMVPDVLIFGPVGKYWNLAGFCPLRLNETGFAACLVEA